MTVATLIRVQTEERADRSTSAPFDFGPDLEVLHRFAHYLKGRPNVVHGHLDAILADRERMARVARRSYWHVNGFAKLRILEGRNCSARLHVWPKGSNRRGDVDPHGHRWEFASWLAAGPGLVETFFDECAEDEPGAESYLRYEYRRAADGKGVLDRTTPSWLRVQRRRQLGPGNINACSTEVVHTVAPVDGALVATVLLQGPERAESTKVFRRSVPESGELERHLSVGELEQLFADVRRAMGSAQ